jgi:glycerophosphoryl diester phosphodiesterase
MQQLSPARAAWAALLASAVLAGTTTTVTPAGAAGGGCPAPPTMDDLPKVVVGGHRNGGLEFPEGSRRGSDALLATCILVLEYDLRGLAGGKPVVMHDPRVDRLTSSSGRVSRLSGDQWRALRLNPNIWFGENYTTEPPLTARQLLNRYKGKALLLLELKDPTLVRSVARLVKRREMTHQVLLQSRRVPVVQRIAATGLHAQLWRTRRGLERDRVRSWARIGAHSVQIGASSPDALVRKALRSRLPIWSFGVNNPRRFRRLKGLGVTGLISDAPLYAARGERAPRRVSATQTRSVTTREGRSATIRVLVIPPAVGRGYPVPGAEVTIEVGGVTRTGRTNEAGRVDFRLGARLDPGRYTIRTRTGTVTVGDKRSLLNTLTALGSDLTIGARATLRVRG